MTELNFYELRFKMKFIDFFAGIGGFRLGMEMAGNECVGHCEIDKFAYAGYIEEHKVRMLDIQNAIEKGTGVKMKGWC